jgi:amino acid permease
MGFLRLITKFIIKNRRRRINMEDVSKKKFYKKWWFWVLAVVVLFIVIGISGGSKTPSQSGENAVANNVPQKEAIKVTATTLSNDYSANEVSADQKYKTNLVEISGIVYSIGKDILDTPYVSLKGDQYGVMNIQCMFSKNNETELAQVTKGQNITLLGTVSGKMMNILVNDCKIVK